MTNKCICDAHDLQPLGECICGAKNPITFGKYKIKRYGKNKINGGGQQDTHPSWSAFRKPGTIKK